MYEVKLCGGRKLRTENPVFVSSMDYPHKVTYIKLEDDWRTAWIPARLVKKVREI